MKIFLTSVLLFSFAGLVGCVSPQINQGFFSKSKSVMLENVSRRKWDSPVIADLDNNGFDDFVITEHGHGVYVYWNTNGQFSTPQKIIGGDTHGLAVGDIDNDGQFEIIISQGGGGGKKPRLPILFKVRPNHQITKVKEYSDFERSRGRAVKLVDADLDGDLDLLLTAFPLPSQKRKGANHLYLNDGKGNFSFSDYMPQAKWLGYKALVADIISDSRPEFIFYGGENLVLSNNSREDLTADTFGNLANISHISGLTPIDIDNDGDLDLFVTRAKHQFDRQTYYDAKTQRFALFVRNETFAFDLEVSGELKLENLQTAFPHHNVYLGQAKTLLAQSKDKNAHRDATVTKEQALGWPENRKGKGLYIGYLGDSKWRIEGETKSPIAVVLSNVINNPEVVEPILLPAYLLKNEQGKFVDVTNEYNVAISGQTTSSVSGDFNNDGWQDLIIMPYGNMAKTAQPILLLNNAGASFIHAEGGLISEQVGVTGGGINTLDYDLDGDLDVLFSNERGRWNLYENHVSSSGNYVIFKVSAASVPKINKIGAKLTVTACGVEHQRVIALDGSPFSQSQKSFYPIGLGTCSKGYQYKLAFVTGEVIEGFGTELNTIVDVFKTR